jgi:molecular chaperone GrpE
MALNEAGNGRTCDQEMVASFDAATAGEGVAAQDLTQRVQELEAALAEAEGKAREYLDGWQRERASFANYRRRIEQERESLSQAAYEEVLGHMLPLLDDLDRACREIPPEIEGHPWVQGIVLIRRRFEQVLQQLGVEPIQARGCKFDPQLHEAISYEEAEGYEEGDIIDEVRRGFRLGERVLRCSAVRVAKARGCANELD